MSAPDYHEVIAIEKRMKDAARKLHSMAGEVGMAITIIDYDSDRRKNLLARYAVKHIKAGESATAADALARSDAAYKTELNELASTYEQAQATRKQWDAEYCSWDTARSLLARQRVTMDTMPETEA